MKRKLLFLICPFVFLGLEGNVWAQQTVVPAGTLLQCTLNEPNFSSATAEVGDPVLCHLRSVTSFGQQAFPRGSYLVGQREATRSTNTETLTVKAMPSATLPNGCCRRSGPGRSSCCRLAVRAPN